MAATIMTHFASGVDIRMAQIVRYAGMANGKVPENIQDLIQKGLPTIEKAAKYKACYLEAPVLIEGNTVSFDYFSVESKNLSVLLKGCEKAILVVATAGMEIDMIVRRAEVVSKAEALILNSIAIAGIEAYMSLLNEFFKGQYEGFELRPRYSPGYGDVPLALQRELLGTLDTKRKIGVALSDSLLMTPSKSVSAIIGIGKNGCVHLDKDCDLCPKLDCEYRLS